MRAMWLIFLCALLGGCSDVPGTAAYDIKHVEKQVAAQLAVPDSAQFATVTVEGPSGLKIVCGQVRARNRAGTYGPFGRFLAMADGSAPMIDQGGPELRTSTATLVHTVFEAAWDQECFANAASIYQQDPVTNMLDPWIGPSANDAVEAAKLAENEDDQ